ncbi:hypothetical protein MTR67_044385 [Solanum verrucosum]|uniref:Uncharacterized protein n=1 Tax=Solanum verrucosum TaxID=315347 RepID=A0AAF0US46_SOLVR|nr:hypothetical protein MTR67_044385 [Solanum verrucosum]
MSSGCDGDRHCEHLGVSQTKQAKKKKFRRLIDPEDIVGSISSAPGRINYDTHLFDVLFGTPSPTGTSPQLSLMRIVDSSSEQSDAMTARPSVTPDDEMPTLAPGQKDRLGRVMIESDGSSLCVLGSRGLYWNTETLKVKKARGSLKGGSLHTGGAKTVGTITREMEKELGRTPIEPEVFKKTHVRKKENESDPNMWVEKRAERTFAIDEPSIDPRPVDWVRGSGLHQDLVPYKREASVKNHEGSPRHVNPSTVRGWASVGAANFPAL